jgi:hypothetical protein
VNADVDVTPIRASLGDHPSCRNSPREFVDSGKRVGEVQPRSISSTL